MALPPSISGGKIATFNEAVSADSLNSEIADWSGGLGAVGQGVIDVLTPKASEIFEKRSATNIFVTHEDIALQSIKGGATTKFNENENLYGFSLFQFTQGLWGGGWSAAKANSLLSSSIDSGLLGNGDVYGTSSYFFNLHPKSMNVSEPFATHIVPTQNGGFFAESQGVVLRTLTIAGTTGYRPSLSSVPSDRQDGTIPHQQGEPTGFLNLLKLRNLFRNYSDLKKNKNKAYSLYMVWYNNKEQEAWFFEPTSFVTNRDAASPFTYNYTITGTLTQKVNFSTVVSTVAPDSKSVHMQVAAMRRGASIINGILSNAFPKLGDDVIGDVFTTANKFLEHVEKIDTTVTQMGRNVHGVVNVLPALLVGVASFASAFSKSWNSANKDRKEIWGAIGDENNSLWESPLIKDMFKRVGQETDNVVRAIAAIAQPEAQKQLLRETSRSGSPTTPPSSIRSPNGGNTQGDAYAPFIIPKTGLILQDWLFDLLGDSGKVDDVIKYNGLDYPYVTDTPSYSTPFKKFLTAGDIIYVPVPEELVTGDINTKINPQKMQTGLYEEILGRDVKLNKSTDTTTGVSEFNLTLSPTGDLDVVVGKENIVQAIDIKLHTERGEMPLHPGFGIVPVMGEKGNRTLNFNLYLSLNDTMLSDGRIKELSDTKVHISGDVVSVKTKVHVIGQVPYTPLSFTMTA